MPAAEQGLRDLRLVAAYLARRDVALPAPDRTVRADALVLCGSAVLAAVDTAASAFHEAVVPRIVVSGGVGHSTPYLRAAVSRDPRYRDVPTEGRPEAEILADVLCRHHGVPAAALSIESRSTNCGENARLSVELLRGEPQLVESLLVVQDPTMQRRTHECFARSLRELADVQMSSFAPFVPVVCHDDAAVVSDPSGRPVWSRERFTALVLGEIERLRDDERGYGPRGAGFIDHVDVPTDVLDAHRRLTAAHPGSTRGTRVGNR